MGCLISVFKNLRIGAEYASFEHSTFFCNCRQRVLGKVQAGYNRFSPTDQASMPDFQSDLIK